MAYTPARLYQGQLPSSETSASPGLLAGAVPAGQTWIIKQIVLCNTSGGAITVSLSLVPSGQTGGASTRLLCAMSMAAAQSTTLDLSQVMNSGDFLSGVASAASSCTVTMSGVIIS